MIYDALTEVLVDAIPEFTGGASIFVNQAPVEAVFCGLFRDGAGGFEIDGYTPTERSGEFTFVVRGKVRPTLVSVINRVSSALTINGLLVDGCLIKACRPLTEPVYYKISVGNMQEISVNFFVNYGIVQ